MPSRRRRSRCQRVLIDSARPAHAGAASTTARQAATVEARLSPGNSRRAAAPMVAPTPYPMAAVSPLTAPCRNQARGSSDGVSERQKNPTATATPVTLGKRRTTRGRAGTVRPGGRGAAASWPRSVRVGTLIARSALCWLSIAYVDPMETAARRRAADTLRQMLPSLTLEAERRLGRAEAVAFLARLETNLVDIYEPLERVYGQDLLERLVMLALSAAERRPGELRELDRKREIDRNWYQRARMVGYVCYADRFAGSLRSVKDKLDYLEELGVTYLHLMPLLKPRPGENDGGYAVMDYRSVDPRLGTMADLTELAGALRERGMS